MLAKELAKKIGGTLNGVAADHNLQGVAALDNATSSDVSFYANPKYFPQVATSDAGAILVGLQDAESITGAATILVDDAYGAFCEVLALLLPDPPQRVDQRERAYIDQSATVDSSAVIAAGVTVGANSVVGANTIVHSGVVIDENVTIGTNCELFANVSIRYGCAIGNDVRIQPGVVVGGDGFGYALTNTGLRKVPQRGAVVIEDQVEIGANTAIDRGTFGDTYIRMGTKIDNLVQIAHNADIGPFAIVVAQAGISGSTSIGMGVQIGGQAGIAGHLSIGDGAQIGAQAGVGADVPAGAKMLGSPAWPVQEFLRANTIVRKLPSTWKKIRRSIAE